MTTTLRFFKLDNRWYADVPNHTLAENEMVAGSDDFLRLSQGESLRGLFRISQTDSNAQALAEAHHDRFYKSCYVHCYNS